MEDVACYVALEDLHLFSEHPFAVRENDSMQQTVDSVKSMGIIVPGIVRQREEGGYEIVTGTDGSGLVSWQDLRRCRLLSVTRIGMLLLLRWRIPTFSRNLSCPVIEPRYIK